jgi:hypothetical protein
MPPASQALGDRVEEGDPAGGIGDDDALADAFEGDTQSFALLGELRGAVLDALLQFGLGGAQFCLDLFSPLDLALQFFGRAHGQGLRRDAHQGDDGPPGDEGRDQFDGAGQAVGGPPEDDGLHEVGGAARQDEGTEEDEDEAERDVFAAQHEVAEDAGDGEIRRPDAQVGKDVQPAVGPCPGAAVPTAWEPGRVE